MFDILVVDDEADIRELVCEILTDEGYKVRSEGTARACMEALKAKAPDLLILDIWLKDSDFDGIDILKHAKQHYPQMPVVIISGHGTIEIAVAAIRQGAHDFIEKPFSIERFLSVVSRIKTAALHEQKILPAQPNVQDLDITGESAEARRLRAEIKRLSAKNSRVLIQGPRGSGKLRAARLIHALSDRAEGPFIHIDGRQTDLMAALLGEQGGADFGQAGLLERAHGGILYVSNVMALPDDVQDLLLRYMADGTIPRPDSENTIELDVRIISSFCNDRKGDGAHGLRQGLIDRLSVTVLELPSLKERMLDIKLIADRLCKEISTRENLPLRHFSQDTLLYMQTVDWVGNFRGLRNAIEYFFIKGPSDEMITTEDIIDYMSKMQEESTFSALISTLDLPLREARDAFERYYLTTQIDRFGGNISRTAGFVAMERSALHRKLKQLDIASSRKKMKPPSQSKTKKEI